LSFYLLFSALDYQGAQYSSNNLTDQKKTAKKAVITVYNITLAVKARKRFKSATHI